MTPPPPRTGPLTGLKVLEFGHYIAGPFCTRVLADLGAEVIKVEPPEGDPVRGWGARKDGHPVWFSIHGRNKLSVVLDLKKQREAALDLARRADVLVENFRPGQLERLGLGPDVLHAINPRLVIARISGFGQDGPYRDRPAFGAIGEAMGGIRHLTGHPAGLSDLPPPRCGISISDDLAGLYAAIGRPDIAGLPRFATNFDRCANVAELDGIIAAWTRTQPAAAAEAILEAADVPCSRLYDVADCAADPHFRARKSVLEVADPLIGPTLHFGPAIRMDGQTPESMIAWPGPALGAHTDYVLETLLRA